MAKHVLVTGGAGFIGSHTVDQLLEQGYQVRVFDSLDPQVHGDRPDPPDYLNRQAEFVRGDVRDRAALKAALEGIDAVIHLAAAVGVGQSQYEISHYVDVNVGGTAMLLDILVNDKPPVRRLLVASSMSLYGEGLYRRPSDGEPVNPMLRSDEQLARRDFQMRDPDTGEVLQAVATPEAKPAMCTSVYALTKKEQEELCLLVGKSYGIPTVACRFFNVYGPRQSLSNPYTGVAAIFSARIKNRNAPLIYEDGEQMRDFISVHDLARGILLLLEDERSDYQSFNIGTGIAVSVLSIARTLARLYGRLDLEPRIVQQFRSGDVRHCYADISKIRALGFEPRVKLEDGLKELVEWGERQEAVDEVEKVHKDMVSRGLIKE